MVAHSCTRCRKNHLGSRDLCEECRTEVSEAYLEGPSAIPEVLAVIEAARAVLMTSPDRPDGGPSRTRCGAGGV
jgi:predicted amidophosphoribosyltransferase